MSTQEPSNITQKFGDLPDPRCGDNDRHPLLNIITIAICAVNRGANNWVEKFGQGKQSWFASFLKLPHGIPPYGTLGQVFRLLNPEEFERRFREWI